MRFGHRSSSPQSKMMGGAVGVLIGVGVLLWSLVLGWRGLASHRWPTTRGIIVESRMESYTTQKGNTRQRPLVRYEYKVDGRTYVSSTWDTAYGTPPNTALADYPVNCEVAVYVDPAAPDSAVLSPGTKSMHLMMLGVGILMIALSAWSYREGEAAMARATRQP